MNRHRLARAFAFGAPLAFIVAAIVGPPDPFSQIALLAVTIPLFVAVGYVSVADSWGSHSLLVFFGVTLVTLIVGSLAVNALHGGATARTLVLAVAVALGAVLTDRFG